ncbi:GNAT family N-acetyltransferase [Marinicrinis sediminis]|uniref:GNAT family N-acetyltransferase n=1 Tax=Marinicrinis sediminis TaxID=1652465 RepID=A0ABW5RAV9_9BACL
MQDDFPILQTERFQLRRIDDQDAGQLFEYFSNDEVTRYYDLDSFTHMQQAHELMERWQTRFDNKEGIRWGIARKEDNLLVGSCGYHQWVKEHFKAEIGFEVAPTYWRKGIITEVLKPVLNYGFEHMQLHRIEAFYDPANLASKRSLEKAGFQYEGQLRQCFFEKGQFVDAEICAILSDDFSK